MRPKKQKQSSSRLGILTFILILTTTGLGYKAYTYGLLGGPAQYVKVPAEYADHPWEFDGRQTESYFGAAVWRAILAGEYGKLERWGNDIRKHNRRFPDGRMMLDTYYDGLVYMYPGTDRKEYTDRLTLIEEWGRKYPNSITQPIALASMYAVFGWAARGNDFADKVTPEGWKYFHERLKKAQQILVTNQARCRVCPRWYSEMMQVALAENEPRADYETFFNEAVTKFPDYIPFYEDKINYLQPKWHGQPGEWQAFALATGQEKGPDYYARLYHYARGDNVNELLKKSPPDWPMLKAGWQKIVADNPRSPWDLNMFAAYAVAAGDRATAKELFAKIGEKEVPYAWEEFDLTFENAKAWAEGGR